LKNPSAARFTTIPEIKKYFFKESDFELNIPVPITYVKLVRANKIRESL
jgi:hypothetical protein